MSQLNVALEDEQKERRSAVSDPPDCLPDSLHCEPSVIATDTSPSPSSNGVNLLSLPWEIVTQIASHLPAQCVIDVLPKVCQTLGKVGEDRLAWQLRAQKLCGPAASFPVGPKQDFDWSRACLEMEELIGYWKGQGTPTEKQEMVEDRQEVAAEAVNGEASAAEANMVQMQLDVDLNAQIQSQNASSSTSSPLEHMVLPSGHIADVNCVLLLGGAGAVCASGSRDRNVNLWDLNEGPRGALMHTLGGRGTISTHRGWVWCLASSGPLLASGSFDSMVKLWDLQAGGAERGLIQCKAAVLCLSCERDTVLAGSHDQRLSIYDTRAANPLVKSLRLHSDAVLCLAADDQFILSGSKDQSVALFDRRAGKLLQKVQLSSYLLSVSFSGSEVWAGDNRGLLHTFSMSSSCLTPVQQFKTHTSLVTGVHYTPGALYTCSSDRSIKIHLPSAPPKTLCTLHHQAGVNGLSVKGGTLAIASGDMNVEVWRPRC